MWVPAYWRSRPARHPALWLVLGVAVLVLVSFDLFEWSAGDIGMQIIDAAILVGVVVMVPWRAMYDIQRRGGRPPGSTRAAD
jgi:hypothetical protein